MLLLALWVVLGLTGCDQFIEVVPYRTPTPVPAPTATATTAPPVTSIPHRITAVSIDLDAPVVEMGWQAVQRGDQWFSEWEMPDNEAAWHKNSSRPGQGSNIVISGHNASTGGQVFATLDELEVGDKITLENEEADRFIYRVKEKNVVRTLFSSSQDQRYLLSVTEPTVSEQLTLITCWPNWSNTHRLIVIAEPE